MPYLDAESGRGLSDSSTGPPHQVHLQVYDGVSIDGSIYLTMLILALVAGSSSLYAATSSSPPS